MSTIRMLCAAGFTAVSALVLAAPAQAAACNNGMCASSVSNGTFIRVHVWRQFGPAGYIHMRSTSNGARLAGTRGSFTLAQNPFGPTRYIVRTCVPVGYGRGECGPWARFFHR